MLNLEAFLQKYYKKEDKIILACSTGPDSMYLLYEILKTSYKDNLVACYFNHKLRKEADEEEEFLKQLGKKIGFQVEIGTEFIKDIHKLYPSKSLEELAREKRYAFLNNVLKIYKAKYILTAHHLDDKIETFFYNLARGTKLTGLINMTEKSGVVLRPLLHLEKSDILKYLEENKLEYKLDKTNKDNTITRNKLRNIIIPKFYDINKNFKKNIEKTMNYFEELKDFLDEEVKKFLGNERYFEISKFNKLPFLLQKEVIRYIYFISNGNSTIGLSEANIAEILKFINGKNNKTIKEIGSLSMKKDGNKIYYK